MHLDDRTIKHVLNCFDSYAANSQTQTAMGLACHINLEADMYHSAMGKSRSATVTCAFLMQRYGITPAQALAQIRETRPFCEPNDGFMKQLELYHRMAETDDIENSPVYQRWLYQREIEMSRACGQAPEAEKIRFEDEHESSGTSDFELKCKKCRYDRSAPSALTQRHC